MWGRRGIEGRESGGAGGGEVGGVFEAVRCGLGMGKAEGEGRSEWGRGKWEWVGVRGVDSAWHWEWFGERVWDVRRHVVTRERGQMPQMVVGRTRDCGGA